MQCKLSLQNFPDMVQMLQLICTQIIESGLQIVVREKVVWVDFLDINQLFKHLDSVMIIILSMFIR